MTGMRGHGQWSRLLGKREEKDSAPQDDKLALEVRRTLREGDKKTRGLMCLNSEEELPVVKASSVLCEVGNIH